MLNKRKTSEDNLIQSIAELIGTPDPNKLQEDIEDGQKSKSATKFAKEIIKHSLKKKSDGNITLFYLC